MLEAIRIVPPTIVAFGALLAARGARREAQGANQATNNVDPNDPDQRTLRERVVSIEASQKDIRISQRRLEDGHSGIQHELGKLTGSVEALIRDH
jgi:hypothetical protein